MPTEKDNLRRRLRMVDEQLLARRINDRRVLDVMRHLPRHAFVDEEFKPYAYDDNPLPIGDGQTISQPYIIALMSERLHIKPTHRVLEIGTGSGYQTAILSQLGAYVYSIERYARLADCAGERLHQLGYHNIDIHIGDGSQGLPDMALFDRIMVTAAVPKIPRVLCSQLRTIGGRMILPVGNHEHQELKLVIRRGERFSIRTLRRVQFVPMIGRYGFTSGIGDDPMVM